MKNIIKVLGVVLVLVGILGFFDNPILGIFEVNTLHNIIHLASGLVLLAGASMGPAQGKKFALILGVVYALVTVLGFVMSGDIVGLITVNMADNLLHLVLAIVLIGVGMGKGSGSSAPAAPSMPSGM